MQISIETTGTLGRRLHVTVPAEQLDKMVDKELQQYANTANLDGFRRGKVPPAVLKQRLRVVKQRYGAPARSKAVDELLQSSLREAITKEKLHFVERSLAVESLEAEPGQPFKYIVTFEVYPEVHVQDLAAVALEKLTAPITEADVEQVLEQIRKQHTQWNDVQRPAQWGDRVTFDVLVKNEGDEHPKTQQENAAMILDETQLPSGFAALKGAQVGDEIVLDIAKEPPQEDQDEATPALQFIAKINAVAEPQLPELDAEFAKQLSVDDGTVEGLRTQVRKHMTQELELILKNKLKMQLIDKLVALHPMELPKALINAEAEHLQNEIREKLAKDMHMQPSDIGELPEEAITHSIETAKRRVTLSLLFSEVVKLNQLKVDEERVHAHVERIAASFEDPRATINMIHGYKEVMQGIRAQAMEEQVIDKLLEQVQFIEQAATYAEVMKLKQAHAHHDHGHNHHDHHDHDHDHENCQHHDH